MVMSPDSRIEISRATTRDVRLVVLLAEVAFGIIVPPGKKCRVGRNPEEKTCESMSTCGPNALYVKKRGWAAMKPGRHTGLASGKGGAQKLQAPHWLAELFFLPMRSTE